MATSDSQKRATIKYMREHLARIDFRVPKEEKTRISRHAEKMGKSVRKYILDLIKEDMSEHPQD